MKVALDTLGCKLNQAETESLARQLVEAGYCLVSPLEEADVYILNTCTVTRLADAKSRHLLRLAHRRNPSALVVATGCYAQQAPQELAQIGGVSLVVGNDGKEQLPQQLREYGCWHRSTLARNSAATTPHSALRTRAFIKIQDGCHSFCAYCIVPLVRGREKSQPVEPIVADVRRRVAEGYQEVVLTGTKVGSYSYNDIGLKGLLERILAETGIARLRPSSLQPQEISPELLRLWQDRRLCAHFHLSLQSGSDQVLRRMKRRYSIGDYQAAVSLLRTRLPQAAITTDVIIGFPGETAAEFQESYNFCRQMEFARIHVFPYSPRPGTEAARLPDKVGGEVKRERTEKMLSLARESRQNFGQRFRGKPMLVLWEKRSAGGIWSGYTDNYIKVYTRSDNDLSNKLALVKLAGANGDGMWGEVVDE